MNFLKTPLHLAALHAKGDVLELLLRNGANINEKDVRIVFESRYVIIDCLIPRGKILKR